MYKKDLQILADQSKRKYLLFQIPVLTLYADDERRGNYFEYTGKTEHGGDYTPPLENWNNDIINPKEVIIERRADGSIYDVIPVTNTFLLDDVKAAKMQNNVNAKRLRGTALGNYVSGQLRKNQAPEEITEIETILNDDHEEEI